MANIDQALIGVFKAEGGFQADPSDPANRIDGKIIGTNKGISAVGFKAFYNRTPTLTEMKALTSAQAGAIYKKNYWDKIQGDKIANQSVAELLFNFVIGSGTGIIKSIKSLANITANKKIMAEVSTPITPTEIGLINDLPQKKFFDRLWDFRKTFYQDVVKKNPGEAKFLKGWLNRLNTHQFTGDPGVDPQAPHPKTFLWIGAALLILAGGIYMYHRRAVKISKLKPAYV